MAEKPLKARTPEDQAKLERFEQQMQFPILVSALLPIILSLAENDSVFANTVIVVTWFVFIYDFVVHLRLVPGYVRSGRGKFDLVVVLLTAPWFLIPGFGASRILGVARLARLARVAKASGTAFIRLAQQLGRVGLVFLGILFTCAYVAYGAERSVNPEFFDFGQSLWWAIVTLTTVGYGDVTPITTNGRIAGVILMLSGVAILGVLAGTLATFFGFGRSDDGGPAPAAPAAGAPEGADDVGELRARLAELDRALAAVREKIG